MTKTELVKALSKKTGFAQKDITELTNALFDTIADTMKTEEVSILGFGKFECVDVKERETKNFLTGEMIKIAAHKSPKFRPSRTLKEACK